jgi:Ca-activated chloride channel family protein
MHCRAFRRVALLAFVAVFSTLILAGRNAGVAAQATSPDELTQGSLIALDAKGQRAGLCPLKRTEVKAEISGFLSRVTVVQEFENPFQDKIEAVYTFPLPQAAAVDDLTMVVGERTIRGRIMRREEAQKAYTEARARGQVASLLNQERPNIFTQSVANILPGQGVKIVISYVETLKYEEGSYEWSFPMVVGARYTPANTEDPTQSGSAPQVEAEEEAAKAEPLEEKAAEAETAKDETDEDERAPVAAPLAPDLMPEGRRGGHDISIEVSLDAGVPIDGLGSETHEVAATRPDAHRAVVRLKDQATIPNKDFVLKYDVAGRRIEDALLTHRDAAKGGFFTFILQPPDRVTAEDVMPKELVFVLDTSGSMQGFPLDKAKETMQLALDGLYPQDTFNLITFSGDTKILFRQPVHATPENLRKAKRFLASRESDGGTEMMKAIRAALAPSDAQGHIRIACFFTDGQVGNDMEIIAEVKQHTQARVFAMGFGDAPNRYLLDQMAEHGRGEVEYVSEKGDSSAVARRFHERVRHPLLTDLEIDWTGVSVSDTYPQRLPDLFSAKPLVLSGRYTSGGQGRLRLRGKLAGRDFAREIPIVLPDNEPQHDVLATLWARRKIDDLMSQDLGGAQQGKMRDDLRESVTQLGLDYRLMTQFTSFVAIEDAVATTGGEPRRVDVATDSNDIVRVGGGGAGSAGGGVSGGSGGGSGVGVVGGVNETVTVTADTVSVDPTDNKIQTNVTMQVGESLPKGTNFTSVLQVAPSVRNEPLASGFQVDGASGSEIAYILDGQEVTNFRTGTLNANNNLPFPLIQEVQVRSSGFDAEHGGASGGVVNVITKSGTNDYHGEFGVQLRPGAWQAAPRPTLRLFTATTPDFFQRAEYLHHPRDRGRALFPTGNFSGALVRDRAWFFLGYTPQLFRTIRDVNYLSSDPRAQLNRFTETYRANSTAHYAFSRLDAAVTDSLRLSGTFTWNPSVYDGLLPPATQQIGSSPAANFGGEVGTLAGQDLLRQQGGRVNANNVTGGLVWAKSSTTVFNVRGGRSFLNEKARPEEGAFSDGVPRTQQFICVVGDARAGCASGFQNFPSNYRIERDVSIRRTLDADVSHLNNDLFGRHQFKFGYGYNGVSNDVSSGYINTGVAQLFYGVPLAELTGNNSLTPTPGAIGSGLLERYGTSGAAGSNRQTLFAQDSWQPHARLTLNLGARIEREVVPGYKDGRTGITFGFGDKIAPRLGAAYDVRGNGKTKIYGFYGRFFDGFKYDLPRALFGGDFYRVDYFELLESAPRYSNYTLQAVLGDRPDLAGGNCPNGGITGGAGLSRCQRDFRIAANDPNASLAAAGGIDPDLKAFRQSELTFGVEHDFGGGYLFAGRYAHKQIDRAVEDIGFFNAQGSINHIVGNPGYGASVAVLRQLGLPATPKAERDYDALEVRLEKRFSNSYYFNANYTLSRLYGNYAALLQTGEAGRDRLNFERPFSLPFNAYTANATPNNGRLPTDRPHVFKFYGGYTLDWANRFHFARGHSTELSGFTTAQSGTPISTRYRLEGIATALLNGRGDLGRTARLTQTDLALRHKYRFGENERFTVAFDLDVLNAFNENNVTGRAQLVNARVDYAILLAGATAAERMQNFFRLGTLGTLIDGDLRRSPERLDASYDQPDNFQLPRTVRFGLRFLF